MPAAAKPGYVGRHGVDERVLARVNAGLGRHLDLAFPLFSEHPLERLDDLRHHQPDVGDILRGEIEERLATHRLPPRVSCGLRLFWIMDSSAHTIHGHILLL